MEKSIFLIILMIAVLKHLQVLIRTKWFIKRFNQIIKHYYFIVWSAEKNTEGKNQKVVKTKNGRISLFSNWPMCRSKNSKFITAQEDSGIIGTLANYLSTIPLVGPILF